MTRTDRQHRCDTLGSFLARERIRKGIPLERAAKETRMRLQRLRDMEADDFSRFSNPSYARMFLIAYAKYLGITLAQIRAALPDAGAWGDDANHYLSKLSADYPNIREDLPSSLKPRSKAVPILVTSIAIVILAIGVPFGVFLAVNLDRLTNSTLPVPDLMTIPVSPQSSINSTAQIVRWPDPTASSPFDLTTGVTPSEHANSEIAPTIRESAGGVLEIQTQSGSADAAAPFSEDRAFLLDPRPSEEAPTY